jgi:hypothetical protein
VGSRADGHTLARTRAQGALEGRPTLGLPYGIPGHPTCLVPFALETRKGFFQDDDPYTRGGYQSGPSTPGPQGWYLGAEREVAPGGFVRWHNAIVHDLESGEQWAILGQRGVIGHWRVLGRPPHPDRPLRSEAIVFLATTSDTNGDGLLNDLDATVAIVAAGDGRDPRVVTPPDAQVWNYSYDHKDSRLYLLVVADTNADGEFDAEDEPEPLVLDVRTRAAAAPAVGEELRRRAQELLR